MGEFGSFALGAPAKGDAQPFQTRLKHSDRREESGRRILLGQRDRGAGRFRRTLGPTRSANENGGRRKLSGIDHRRARLRRAPAATTRRNDRKKGESESRSPSTPANHHRTDPIAIID